MSAQPESLPELRPVLIVPGEDQAKAAESLMGEVYECISLERANGQLAGRQILYWHVPGDLHRFLPAIEALCDAASSAKVLIPDKGQDRSPVECKRRQWGYEQVAEFAVSPEGDPRLKPYSKALIDRLLVAEIPLVHQEPEASLEAVDQPGGVDSEPEAPDDAEEEALASFEQARSTVFSVDDDLTVGANIWPQAVDLWGGTGGLPEVQYGWFHPAVAEYLLDQSALRGVDPCQAAISCVVACSALIRESIYLQMMADSSGWQERARLWGAVIGDPSTRKGVGIDIGADHMHALSKAGRAADEAALTRYGHAEKIYQGRLASYYKDAQKNPLAQLPPREVEYPLSTRLYTNDATLEALGHVLAHHARGKICMRAEELSSWFGSFDAFRNGHADRDRPTYLSAYEGERDKYIDRVGEGRAFFVPTWSLCVLGGIQPSTFATIAAKLGSDGMLQRFMLSTSARARMSEERKPDSAAVMRWEKLCERLLAMEPHPNAPVRLSPDAQAFRRECAKWFFEATGAGFAPGLTFWLGKCEGLLGRLMLTSHCIESADKGRAVPDEYVSIETAQRCFAYIKDFLFPHAIHFYETAQPEDEKRPLRKLAGIVLVLQREGKATIVPSDIGHKYTYWRGFTSQQKREIMAALCEIGFLRADTASHYAINPALCSQFEDRTDSLVAERAAQDELRKKRGFKPREPGED